MVPAHEFSSITVEPSHNLHLLISEWLENCFVSFIAPVMLCTKKNGGLRGRRAFENSRGSM